MRSVPLSRLPSLMVVTLVVASLITHTFGECSTGSTSYTVSVAYKEGFNQWYAKSCWLFFKCDAYRTAYRTAYRYETRYYEGCCSGFRERDSHCYDINECSSNPCQNGGTCSNQRNRYSCSCTSGWYGSRCQYDVNECSSNPCMNGGTCLNQRNRYSCSCTSGWYGSRCQYDVNECNSMPCQNGGRCNNRRDAFSCDCLPGWTGGTCAIDVDECESQPCLNNGTCHDQINAFSCTCPNGWTGTRCDEDIDECILDHNCSQRCINQEHGTGFNCACYEGYQLQQDGKTCEDIDECAEVGDCDQECSNNEGSYICSCSEGYSLDIDMRTCNDIDECMSNPCIHGVCNDLINSYSCTCMPGWSGFHCNDDIDECSSADLNACSQNCTNTNGSYNCTCVDGYELDNNGTTCNDIDECAVVGDCDQECSNNEGSYICSCREGYSLDVDMRTCNDIEECMSDPCIHGVCNDLINSYSCTCRSGWSGFNCTDDIDECDSSPCVNDGTCVNLPNAFSCNCTEGWYGIYCQNGVPTVIHHPRNQTVDISDRVVLNCGFLYVQHFDWWKDGKKVPFTRDMSDYVINATTPPDQGYYSCIGSQENWPAIESNRAVVRIRNVSAFYLTFKLVRNFTTFQVDQESEAYQTLVSGITATFEDVFEKLKNQTEALSQGAIYLHVNDLLPDDGVVVDMRAYIANSDLTPQEELDFMWSGLSSLANSSDGFLDRSLLLVESTLLCPSISWSSLYGVVQFASGELHSWDESSGQCPWFTVNAGEPIARAVCSGDYISPCAWKPSDNCGGNKTADQLLISLQQQANDEESIQVVLSVVNMVTKNSTNITSAGVTAACGVIQQIGTLDQPTEENAVSVVDILGNLAGLDESVIEEAELTNGAVSDATLALEDILLSLKVSEDKGFQHVTPDVVVQAISLQSDDTLDGLVLSVTGDGSANQDFDGSNVQISSANRGSGDDEDHVEAAIFIPPEAIALDDMGNVAFTVYRDDSFFITDDGHKADVVEDSAGVSEIAINTNVIGASIGSNGSKPLNAPVTIILAHRQQNASDPQCVFWDYSMNAWSRDGCHITNTTETHTECQCNHLTSFAVLMDVSGNKRLSEKVERFFRILSLIGCTFSIIGLVMTLVVYLTDIKKLRHSQPLQILMCLCATLLSLYIFFIIMTSLDQHRNEMEVGPGSCGFIAAILHFSVLSSMTWMGIEGVNMFLMIVRVMNTYIPFFMLKASVIAWGLPAVVVILTGAIARDNYANSDYCFLQKWPLVSGLLIPMAIILLHNVIVFFAVMRRLLFIDSGSGKATELKTDDLREIKRRLKNAVSILLLLGLTWIIGYLTVIEQLNLAIHVVFILLNSLQGFFIFVFYVLRQPRSRARLAELVGHVRVPLCCSRGSYTISTSDSLSMKQTSMTGTHNPVWSTTNESELYTSHVDASTRK